MDVGMSLTHVEFLDEISDVLGHRGPVVPRPEGLLYKSSATDVLSTDSFMNLGQDVIALVTFETLY